LTPILVRGYHARMKAETEKWLTLAKQDMGMAEAAWEREYYSGCIARCQQAVEKLLKAGLVEEGIEFRKTHDLPELARLRGLNLTNEQMDVLAKLTEQYLPSRYGDVYTEFSRETAESYYVSTRDIFEWLLQQLT